MTDYSIRHEYDFPDWSLPPVHFEGIRWSGDADPYSLKMGNADYAGTMDYGSSAWFSGINKAPTKPYVGIYSTGMKYQFFLGQYSDHFPESDGARQFVIENPQLARTLGDLDENPDFIQEYNEYPDNSRSSLLIKIDPATGYGDVLNIGERYAFGWGDVGHITPRFSPHLKEGYFSYLYHQAGYAGYTTQRQNGQHYQFGFLVDNDCDEVEIEFEIINEHPVIAWDFTLGACLNKKGFTEFQIYSRDEDLFVDSPKIVNAASGYCSGYYGISGQECSSTKYKTTLKNINCGEGAGLLQIAVLSMDFNSRGEDYLPYSLYQKITATGSENMDGRWKQNFSQYFWKGRYGTPTAFHLHPWYNKAKSAGWDSATGFFDSMSEGADLPAVLEDSQTRRMMIDHGYLGITPKLGNYSDTTYPWTSSSFSTVGPYGGFFYSKEEREFFSDFFFNHGGFGKAIKTDAWVNPYEWDQTVEFAPISITANSITPKKRKKQYYATYSILGLTSGKYLTILDPSSGIQTGQQVHHIGDYDYGQYGLLNGLETASHSFVYERASNKIALKESKNCDPDFCSLGFDSGDILSGVLRFATLDRTGAYCRFESGSQFVFSPHSFKTGDLISFAYINKPSNFTCLEGEDYVVSHVEATMIGGNDAYKFKLTPPRSIYEPSNSPKIFNLPASGTGYIGNIFSGTKETNDPTFIESSVELVSVQNCSGVLPSLPTKYYQPNARTATTQVIYTRL